MVESVIACPLVVEMVAQPYRSLDLCWSVEGSSVPDGDEHNLLNSLLEVWKERDLPLPRVNLMACKVRYTNWYGIEI